MNILCVIPARYASTRLPGKPLADINGKPMICRVYERAVQARGLTGVLVATDDRRVYDAVVGDGGQAMMTAADHPTGTDRLAEVARVHTEAEAIINVQGDEPLIEPSVIEALAAALSSDEHIQMVTVKTEITNQAEIDNPNNVKVVTDKNDFALYFSRSRLPYPRHEGAKVYKHIGIYGYTRSFLLQYAALPPAPLERAESLEQLRVLENGFRIKVIETKSRFVGVDTSEDLAMVNQIYRQDFHSI